MEEYYCCAGSHKHVVSAWNELQPHKNSGRRGQGGGRAWKWMCFRARTERTKRLKRSKENLGRAEMESKDLKRSSRQKSLKEKQKDIFIE